MTVYAVWRVSQRKARMVLAVKGGTLGRGGEPGTPRRVFDKGEGMSRRSDNTSKRLGTKGVSGTFLVTKSVGATRYYGQYL